MDEERIEGGGEEGRTREKMIKREGICDMYLRGDQRGIDAGMEGGMDGWMYGGREGGREGETNMGRREKDAPQGREETWEYGEMRTGTPAKELREEWREDGERKPKE
jgi:hypothetical protein